MGEQRASIFEAQLMIMEDPELLDVIEQRIRDEKAEPESIVKDEFNKYLGMMFDAEDPYMSERAMDVQDIRNRIIRN
jgi:Phosphoenolpyruvate-protein kinase (PTS system EI component in bacteria)